MCSSPDHNLQMKISELKICEFYDTFLFGSIERKDERILFFQFFQFKEKTKEFYFFQFFQFRICH